MVTFTPVNSLETKLRALLSDKTTPYWSFYTPLAAAELWIIVRNHPELDGSDLVAPEGQNPEVCTFNTPDYSFIGIYTAECRVREIFEKLKLSPAQMTFVSAPGYQLLKFLVTFDDVDHLWINGGLPECQKQLDIDLVEILLSRPEPEYHHGPEHKVGLSPDENPQRFLAPLGDFLSRQPNVRAVWIFGQKRETPLPAGHHAYEIGLLMADPEDESLRDQIETMAKALTPVEMEWTTALLMGDDRSLRNLAEQQAPYYQAPGFLQAAQQS